MATTARARAKEFCRRFGLDLPILLAPMAGACPPGLSAAVANAGGMAALGALTETPEAIAAWIAEFRRQSNRAVQINLWIPDPPPRRDPALEAEIRAFLEARGPMVPADAGDAVPLDFAAQFEALVAATPNVASSIMGLFSPDQAATLKAHGIAWFACVTTLAEARAAEAAGADAVVAQGFEAGGHRGAFVNENAERQGTGSLALLPRLADHLTIPIIAAGGIADSRGIAAALTLGASAVQIGTGFLRAPEAKIHPVWAATLADLDPTDTMPTRGFSGRLGRAVATAYVRDLIRPGAPAPAPYPVQRGLSAAMRVAGLKTGTLDQMQAWAGQAAALARAEPAGDIAKTLWAGAESLLP